MDPTPDQHLTHPVPPEDDEISLVEIATVILRNWRIVAVLPVLLALVAAASRLINDRSYAASASFLPQAARSGGGGGAAALAERFGVSLGSDGSGQSPQFYVDLLWSRPVLRQAVESEYEVPGEGGATRRATLIELFEIEAAAGEAAPWRAGIARLGRNISASVVRETGIVQFTVSAPDSALAERIAERLLQLLDDFNREVLQSRAQEESRFIGARVAEARAKLLAAERALEKFLRQNREFRHSPELLFQEDRLQRQVSMLQEVYTSLMRSQEQARIDAVRDTPLFTVIEYPAGSAVPEARLTVMATTLGFIIGLMVALSLAFIREFVRRGRRAHRPSYEELEGLARETWEDLRRPARWLRWREKRVPAEDG